MQCVLENVYLHVFAQLSLVYFGCQRSQVPSPASNAILVAASLAVVFTVNVLKICTVKS